MTGAGSHFGFLNIVYLERVKAVVCEVNWLWLINWLISTLAMLNLDVRDHSSLSLLEDNVSQCKFLTLGLSL